jgi:hypothetical protein
MSLEPKAFDNVRYFLPRNEKELGVLAALKEMALSEREKW